jgi:amicyanin
VLTAALVAGTAMAGSASVAIRDFAFRPSAVTVRVGDSVTWTNQDDVVHTVRWSAGGESPELANGQSYSRSFTAPGTYAYVCGPHPFMTGSVQVLAAATGGGGSGGEQPTTDAEDPIGGTDPTRLALLAGLLAAIGGAGLFLANRPGWARRRRS